MLLLADETFELSETSLRTLPVRLRELVRGALLASLRSDAALGRDALAASALEPAELGCEARTDKELTSAEDCVLSFLVDCFG